MHDNLGNDLTQARARSRPQLQLSFVLATASPIATKCVHCWGAEA